MLSERYSKEEIAEALSPYGEWRFPDSLLTTQARNDFAESPANRGRIAHVVKTAESLRGKPWTPIAATLYMDYARTGLQEPYISLFFQRRNELAYLVLAEYFEGKGRFLDDIANGVWSVCEESTWCCPACVSRTTYAHGVDPLVVPGVDPPELFACSTALLLAETCGLLKDRLDSFSPALGIRMRDESMRRVVEPIMQCNDIYWFSMKNNWAPWCSAGALAAGMAFIDDRATLATLAHKLMGVVDGFLEDYALSRPDGGCDEGPEYWNMGAGSLLLFLELLYLRSQGRINVYDEPLIHAIGSYIYRVHLDADLFANYADSPMRCVLRQGVVYRYGERIGSGHIMRLVELAMRSFRPDAGISRQLPCPRGDISIYRDVLWATPSLAPQIYSKNDADWFPNLQVAVIRERPELRRGFVVAVKGGHNGETHNHNDVGHFILTSDGEPVVVDLGPESYVKGTFGSERYEKWTTRGRGHNSPVVNGFEQIAGAPRAAKNVQFSHDAMEAAVSLDLTAIFPEEAGVLSLCREVRLTRQVARENVVVRDCFDLNPDRGNLVELYLYSPMVCERVSDGVLCYTDGVPIKLTCFPPHMDCTVHHTQLDDPWLKGNFGDSVNLIRISYSPRNARGSYTLTFERYSRWD